MNAHTDPRKDAAHARPADPTERAQPAPQGADLATASGSAPDGEPWPEPDLRLLGDLTPPAPELPLEGTFGPRWARWIRDAAESKSAPPDYVAAALLVAAGSAIGNARWASPWAGWTEPPVLWAMAVGSPSAGKSPALDAVLSPLRAVEAELRRDTGSELAEWRDRAELARMAESAWKDAAKAALKAGEEPPARPDAAILPDEPFPPRLAIADGTVERLAVILAKQPKGTLMARDELAGWLQGMTRYANGGSDRPFWLEAYGGRSYTVERMGRDPVHVDRLAIGVLGSIQPDRLKSLLVKADDDGLLARFLPVWPEPAPLRRPGAAPDDAMLERALARLHGLQMLTDERDRTRPWVIPFSEGARDALDTFRQDCREWEGDANGLLLSFTGKLPGLVVRLALVLAYLDWCLTGDMEPAEVDAATFGRAARFVGTYGRAMARRCYAERALTAEEEGARKLYDAILDRKLKVFSARQIHRLQMRGLRELIQVRAALLLLNGFRIVRRDTTCTDKGGGRKSETYVVNPKLGQPYLKQ